MPAPTPVDVLHAEYAMLQDRAPSTLTRDERQSLIIYACELAAEASADSVDAAPRHVTDWISTLFALESFVLQEGRMPRENRSVPTGSISVLEKQRANNVRAQRRAFAAGRLCTYQIRRLLCIPGFSFQPLEDNWQANCAAYARFTATHGAAPKLRSTDPSEQALARWAAKTRLAYRAGTLSAARIDALTHLEF